MDVMGLYKKKSFTNKVAGDTMHFFMISVIQYLGDKRCFKPETILQAVKYIQDNTISLLDENLTTVQEAEEDIKERYGIEFSRDKNTFTIKG